MRHCLVLSTVLLALLLPGNVEAEGPRSGKITAAAKEPTDLDRIQGQWEIVSCIERGESMPLLVGAVCRFQGDRFEMHEPGKPPQGSAHHFRLDWKHDPKHFDWVMPGFPKIAIGPKRDPADDEIVLQAIYTFEGDTLKLLFSVDQQPRPSRFDARSQQAGSLWVLKRVKESQAR